MTGSSPALNARQLALLRALNACGDEMSGQQLHRSLDDEASMGLATVYRNLRQLQQRGLVRCRHLPTGEARKPKSRLFKPLPTVAFKKSENGFDELSSCLGM